MSSCHVRHSREGPAHTPGSHNLLNVHRGIRLRTQPRFVHYTLNSIQFIQLCQIHYKSKRPNGYRISRITLYQTLVQEIQCTK